MIFSIIILLIIGAVAYFHYAQGLYSATISAICAIFSSTLTIAYHENILNLLLKGAVANYAEAMVLCGFFAVCYSVMRYIADKALPGNVRYPLLVDRIGSVLMGIVAGVYSAGVLALAAESLPLGPTVAGYAPYAIDASRSVIVQGAGRSQDAAVIDGLKDYDLDEAKLGFDPAKAGTPLIPVDSIAVGLVRQLSNGAFSNHHPLDAIHPNWPLELFEQRLGVQIGAKRVLINLPALEMVTLQGVYQLPSVPQIDGDAVGVREGEKPLVTDTKPLVPEATSTLLVVRVGFETSAADEDNKVRFSCASVRMVAWQGDEGNREFSNYNPIGTLEDATTLYRNKPDDPLVTEGGKSVDFVFIVPRGAVFKEVDPKAKEIDIKDGVFVEVKRMARLDLADSPVKTPPPVGKDVEVLRKDLPQAKNLPKRSAARADAAVAAPVGPVEVSDITVSNKLFTKLKPDTTGGDSAQPKIGTSGTAVMSEKQFQELSVKPTQDLAEISDGDFATDELAMPPGMKLVQAVCKPAKGDAWEWAAKLGAFKLTDASGSQYPALGAVARVKQSGGADRIVARYNRDGGVTTIEPADGRPYDVWIVFAVPSGTQIAQVLYDGKPIFSKNLAVP